MFPKNRNFLGYCGKYGTARRAADDKCNMAHAQWMLWN